MLSHLSNMWLLRLLALADLLAVSLLMCLGSLKYPRVNMNNDLKAKKNK